MSKYYLCSVCGNLIEVIDDSGQTPVCCNRSMVELRSASTDGKVEKHLPVIEVIVKCKHKIKCVKVMVGESLHPSEQAHYIKWIQLVTDKGRYMHFFSPSEDPVTLFFVGKDEKIEGAYSYCNLHGLWYGNKIIE